MAFIPDQIRAVFDGVFSVQKKYNKAVHSVLIAFIDFVNGLRLNSTELTPTGAVDFNSQDITDVADLYCQSITINATDNFKANYYTEGGFPGTNYPLLALYKLRGTFASPSVPQSVDYLGGFSVGGYYGGAQTYYKSIFVRAKASETWSSTAAGASLEIQTTANTTITSATVAIFNHDGHLTLGSVAGTGAYNLYAAGVYAGDSIFTGTTAAHVVSFQNSNVTSTNYRAMQLIGEQTLWQGQNTSPNGNLTSVARGDVVINALNGQIWSSPQTGSTVWLRSDGMLVTLGSINAKTTGTTDLLTVPTGLTAYISHIVVVCTAASSITVPPSLGFGVASGEDDVFASTTLTGFTDASHCFVFRNNTTAYKQVESTEVLKLGIDTGATGTSMTIRVFVFGGYF
jgi:hypothetical protein